VIEQTVDIPTKDGKTTTFIVHPDRGGPFPVILFYMDAPAIREELRDMSRRLASSGYYVVLPNMYYRQGVMELGPLPASPDAPERKKMFEYMNSLTIPLVMDDTEALLKYVDAQAAASKGPIGCVGYCMSGQFAVNAAARWPNRVAAAASIYGTRLVTDAADSPHIMAKKAKADMYFGCAERDHYVPLEMIDALKNQLEADRVKNAEVELYPSADHGFAFPSRPVYNKAAAEKHWERLLSLYKRKLGKS
jgi:carboxymethylenebutenolidase